MAAIVYKAKLYADGASAAEVQEVVDFVTRALANAQHRQASIGECVIERDLKDSLGGWRGRATVFVDVSENPTFPGNGEPLL